MKFSLKKTNGLTFIDSIMLSKVHAVRVCIMNKNNLVQLWSSALSNLHNPFTTCAYGGHG